MRIKKLLFLAFCFLFMFSCKNEKFNVSWTQEKAPEYFKARFETTQGDFEIEANRSWSPLGVDRLYQLITHEFYTDIAIYRVVPNYVVQFGINNDSIRNQGWSGIGYEDEPVLQKNDSMTIAFARYGPQSRTTQLFINLRDNNKLDTSNFQDVLGFPVVAKVIKGMENVHKFYGEYGNKLSTKQDSIYKFGNAFLAEKYPKLDYIKKAYLIK
jgi:peptidyl-prolyl cis-trans isomerase A (cyclophilin A)|uniref:peptidylprolyl isomerase n=1 Tax=Polaribacter sp. TaxID=1920175 RepID=UPI0040474F0E